MPSGSTATTDGISISVTGGAGFVGLASGGSSDRRQGVRCGCSTISTQASKAPAHISPAPAIVRGDVSDPAALLEATAA